MSDFALDLIPEIITYVNWTVTLLEKSSNILIELGTIFILIKIPDAKFKLSNLNITKQKLK